MKTNARTWAVLVALLLGLPLTTPAVAVTTFNVSIDTTAVQGKPGRLAFDFTNSDPSSNTVSILNFATNGVLGLPETQGGLVTGDIILGLNPAPVTTIQDGFFFNQLMVTFTSFATTITFTLQLTESHTPGKPFDQLAVFIIRDKSDQPLIASTDTLGGNTLFAVSITGAAGGQLEKFSPTTQPTPSALQITVPPLATLVAAVLPSSRSVQVGIPATVFATILNAGPGSVFDAGPFLSTSLPAAFAFQTTDPATNAVIGPPNTRKDIAQSGGQTFVIALTPSDAIAPTDVVFDFSGVSGASVTTISGVNTLLLSSSATPISDIVALAATIGNTGIVDIPGATGTGVFAVATVNVGATGVITASADTGAATPPVTVALCQTDPASSQCITAIGPSVTTTINANATPTFGIFVTGTGTVPFDPATNRIFVRFKDAGGVTRGSTSVAVRTQ